MTNYKNKLVLIIGRGVSGNGARFALEFLGARCNQVDDIIDFSVIEEKPDLIVISPSVAKTHPIYMYARDNGIKLIGELELGYTLSEGVTVAITGTNGKTTTTELTALMLIKGGLVAEACGNIGISFAKACALKKMDVAVVETSSFQLESIHKFHPHIACITNISPDHLDRHKTMAKYVKLKLSVCKNQTPDDFLILPYEGIAPHYLSGFCPQSRVLYVSAKGMCKGCYALNGKIYFMGDYVCDVDRIKMQGEHNLYNALFAICIARLMDVPNVGIVSALSEFETGGHRLRLVDNIAGRSYYNDSKGTNIGASLTAARQMQGPTCLILGGSDKGYEFDELIRQLPQTVVKIYAIGETARKVRDAALRNKFLSVELKSTLEQAVEDASREDVENVLLSPACASFDMFKNYCERGERFEEIVRNLKRGQ